MDTSDTLTLARVDRENQGPWEAEYSYEGEADLHRHYNKCEKNPEHKNFIPVDKFSLEDLPQDYRYKDMMDYIRAVSDLTVRVTVEYVSDRRPATVPGSYKPYPGYNRRGQQRMTVGTGWVQDVKVYNGSQGFTCNCKNCKDSCTPETNFAIIDIETVNHVVFDDLEAEYTTCHLFFDRGSTPDTCSGVITLTGMSVKFSAMDIDNCSMTHYTHDLGLAQRLHRMWLLITEAHLLVLKKVQPYKYTWRLPPADKQPFCFIVSHPHGCSKQISLGGFTSIHTFNFEIASYLYSTATCPGSSGAKICVPDSPHSFLGFASLACHCGAADAQPGMNYCHIKKSYSSGFFPVEGEVNFLSKEMLHAEEGSAEYHLDCGGEEELHKHYGTCQRNPGHKNFFPAEKFSMDNLPLSYRKPEIMDFIKLMSDLTVRLSVTCVSEERSGAVPGTDVNKGGNQIRIACGWIFGVDKYMNDTDNKTCRCNECLNSSTPKTKFAYITIDTAEEFEYVRLGRDQVTCLLSLSINTPDTCEDVVTLTDCTDITKLTFTSSLEYVTHDLDLAERLACKLETLRTLKFSDTSEYSSLKRNMAQTVSKNPGEDPTRHIVISYPHGLTKQISIGYPGNDGNSDTEEDRSPYTRITCPGSIGAPTFVLGEGYLYPWRK